MTRIFFASLGSAFLSLAAFGCGGTTLDLGAEVKVSGDAGTGAVAATVPASVEAACAAAHSPPLTFKDRPEAEKEIGRRWYFCAAQSSKTKAIIPRLAAFEPGRTPNCSGCAYDGYRLFVFDDGGRLIPRDGELHPWSMTVSSTAPGFGVTMTQGFECVAAPCAGAWDGSFQVAAEPSPRKLIFRTDEGGSDYRYYVFVADPSAP